MDKFGAMTLESFNKYLKKYTRNTVLLLLTLGASLTLGLLSFAGMFVLWPIVGLASAAFVLAIAYEGEIFWQNLKAAWKTLFTPRALKRQMFREYIEETIKRLLPDDPSHQDALKNESPEARTTRLNAAIQAQFEALEDKNVPPVILDYLKLVYALNKMDASQCDHNGQTKIYRKQLSQKIKRFELELADQLFSLKNKAPKTAEQTWFAQELGAAYIKKYQLRYGLFTLGKVFSILSGAAIFAGTAYLLFDAFMTVPLLMLIPASVAPALILTFAAVAGVAYILITYNSITSMLNNKSLQRFRDNFKDDLKEGPSVRLVLKVIAATIFLGLTAFLTVCTAGTWWTIGQNIALFVHKGWLIAGTFFAGASAAITNLFNTLCTWFGVKEACNNPSNQKSAWAGIKYFLSRTWDAYKKSWALPGENNTSAQNYNIFHILINIILLPMNILLFIAHVISIGVSGDQIEGVPKFISTAFCALDEAKEDYERFVPHEHAACASLQELLTKRSTTAGGHNHSLNLPGKAIKLLLASLYALAILWHWVASKFSTQPLSLFTAAKNILDPVHEHKHEHEHAPSHGDKKLELTLEGNKFDAKLYVKSLKERLSGPFVRGQKSAALKCKALDGILFNIDAATDESAFSTALQNAPKKGDINVLRFSIFQSRPQQTYTKRELETLEARVMMSQQAQPHL